MHEFFKKYAHLMDGDDAMHLIHDKMHEAKEYYKADKTFEAVKCLKEIHGMIGDFVSILES